MPLDAGRGCADAAAAREGALPGAAAAARPLAGAALRAVLGRDEHQRDRRRDGALRCDAASRARCGPAIASPSSRPPARSPARSSIAASPSSAASASSRSTTSRCSRGSATSRVAGAARRGDSTRAWRDPSIAGADRRARRLRQRAAAAAARSATRSRRAPKPFIGYSDITSLLTFLTTRLRHRRVSRADARRPARRAARPATIATSFIARCCRARAAGRARAAAARGAARRAKRRASLLGGTLTQLLASLGTPYAFDPPPGYVLFLDEVGERPYRLDRMVTQLRQTGLLARASRGRLRRAAAAATSRRGDPTARARRWPICSPTFPDRSCSAFRPATPPARR